MSSPPPDPRRARVPTELPEAAPTGPAPKPESLPARKEGGSPPNERSPAPVAPTPWSVPPSVYPSAAAPPPPAYPQSATPPPAAPPPIAPPAPAPYPYTPASAAYGYPQTYPGAYPAAPYGYPASYPPSFPGSYPYPGSPYGYMPPFYYAPPAPPGQKTTEGLHKLKSATNSAIVFNVVTAIFSFAVLGLLFGPRTAGTVGLALALLVLFGLAVIVLGLIVLVYGIQGVSRLRDGKREFNPDHERSMDRAVRFLAAAVVVEVVGVVSGVAVSFAMESAVGGPPVDPAAQAQIDLVAGAVGGIFNLAFVVLMAVALQGFIERLMTQKGRAARNLFIGLSLCASFANLGMAVASALLFAPVTGPGPTLGDALGMAPLAALLSVGALWIYRVQLDRALDGSQALIQYGGKDPDATAPAVQSPQPVASPVYAAVR